MIQTFTIEDELTDLNTYINAERSNRFLAAKIKREETNRCAFYARKAQLEPITEYPIYIRYTWVIPDRRKDLDNIAFAKKWVQDGLVQAGIIENDGQKQIAGFVDDFKINKDNPCVIVELSSISTYR